MVNELDLSPELPNPLIASTSNICVKPKVHDIRLELGVLEMLRAVLSQ